MLLKKLHGKNVIFSVLLPKIAVTFKHSELITNVKRDCTMYMYNFLEMRSISLSCMIIIMSIYGFSNNK